MPAEDDEVHFRGANGARRCTQGRSDWLHGPASVGQQPVGAYSGDDGRSRSARRVVSRCRRSRWQTTATCSCTDGKVYSGSDWIPQDRSINSLATNRGLVVRYPVRMKEDLLPYTKITTSELRQLLARESRTSGMSGNGSPGRSDRDRADRTGGHVHPPLENRGQERGRLRFRLCLRGGRRPVPAIRGASLQLQRQRRNRKDQGEEGALTVVESSAGGRRRYGKSDRLDHRPDDAMHGGWPRGSPSRIGRAAATRSRSTETRRHARPGQDPFHPGRDQRDTGSAVAYEARRCDR